MQVVIACVLSLAVSGLAKPFYGQFVRVPRSHGYGGGGGGGGYISPCASAGAYHHAIPSYHQGSSYGIGPIGYGHGQIGGYGGYSAPHYRADEMEESAGEEPEMMNFSEMDQSENAPEARYVSIGGGYGAPHAISGISTVASASPGAVGVFPGAHVSGCNVPLLLSCSPSIVPGRIVSHGHAAYGAGSYGAGAGSYGAGAIAGAGAGVGAYRSEAEAPHDQKPSEQPEAHTTTVHEAAKVTPPRTQ